MNIRKRLAVVLHRIGLWLDPPTLHFTTTSIDEQYAVVRDHIATLLTRDLRSGK